MNGSKFIWLLIVAILVVVALIDQRGSESVPSPAENEVVAGTAHNIATGDNLSKAAAKAITGPVKKEILRVGHRLIDDSGARAYESAREYGQAESASGEILVVLVWLSEFKAHFGLRVLAMVLAFGGIATVVFRMMRNIQRFG